MQLIRRNYKTVVLTVFFAVVLSFSVLLLRPLEYEAKSRLLIQETKTSSLDPYTVAKTNEYLGNLLVGVIDSDLFFEEALASGFNIDKAYFGSEAAGQLVRWNKAVAAKAVPDIGIIEVSVYHRDKYQAEQIAHAVNYVLRTDHGAYDGRAESASIKIINRPLASNWPVRPNLVFNLALAVALGLIFGVAFTVLTDLKSTDRSSGEIYAGLEFPEALARDRRGRQAAANERAMTAGADEPYRGGQPGGDLTDDIYAYAAEEPVSEGGYLSDDFYPGDAEKGEAKEIFGEGNIKNLFGRTI